METTAAELPPGCVVTRIGNLPIPFLACEAVQNDKREEMRGWVDVTLWSDGNLSDWLDGDNPTAFLGMFAISVPANTRCRYYE